MHRFQRNHLQKPSEFSWNVLNHIEPMICVASMLANNDKNNLWFPRWMTVIGWPRLVALARTEQGTQHDIEGNHISFPGRKLIFFCVGDIGSEQFGKYQYQLINQSTNQSINQWISNSQPIHFSFLLSFFCFFSLVLLWFSFFLFNLSQYTRICHELW